MKLLLRQDIPKLGYVGDVVTVSSGYARNYLLPHHLAMPPTEANLRKIESDKQAAAERRAKIRAEREATLKRLAEVEVTIHAAANPEGRLYGSVGAREIAQALQAEGHAVDTDYIRLSEPIRALDAVMVPVDFGDDLRADIKVWVVRDTPADEDEEADTEHDGEDAEGRDADHIATGGVDALADDEGEA